MTQPAPRASDSSPPAARPCSSCEASCRYRLPRDECALIYAERGGMTLGEIAEVFGITGEGIRVIQEKALRKLRKRLALVG